MKFQINGRELEATVNDNIPLLWVIRDQLGMMGTKFGCGIGQCGACTVLLDGSPVRSCSYPAVAVSETAQITTIEGLATENNLSRVQAAWVDKQVAQCGYCQSGQILAATALLSNNPNPSDADIDQAMSNICRCGTYPRIKAAIKSLATQPDSSNNTDTENSEAAQPVETLDGSS